jgi:hypothetical protein
MVHTDGEILVHLKMKVRWIHAVVVTDGAELLSFLDLLPLSHSDSIEMGIERVRKMELPLFDPSMADDHYITPSNMNITG